VHGGQDIIVEKIIKSKKIKKQKKSKQ